MGEHIPTILGKHLLDYIEGMGLRQVEFQKSFPSFQGIIVNLHNVIPKVWISCG